MRAFLARRACRALLTAALLLIVAGIVAETPPAGCPRGGCGAIAGTAAWAWSALRFDFGATAEHQPVAAAIGAAVPATLLLVAPAALIILVLGWGAGLALALAEANPDTSGRWAATSEYTRPQSRVASGCLPSGRRRRLGPARIFTSDARSLPRRLGLLIARRLAWAAGIAQVLPIFWLGGLLVAVVSIGAGWLPPGGIADPAGPAFGSAAYVAALSSQPLSILGDLCRHLLLPCCTLALAGLATAPRLLKALLSAQWTTQHMRAARGAGLGGRRLAWRAVRPALPPLLASTAADAPLLASALVLVEYLYGWPGVGLLAYQAARAGDTSTMGALLLLFGLAVIALSLVADALAALADPRLRRPAA